MFLSCDFLSPSQPQEPIVVITFDDADTSIYTFAFKTMMEHDSSWSATNFLCVTYVGETAMLDTHQLHTMEQAGWETGGHGYTHANLTSLPLDSAEFQVSESRKFLVENNLTAESFAYAFGNYNDRVQAMTGKYFRNIRNTHDYYYTDGVDRKSLGYFAVKDGHSADDIIARVEEARRRGSPLVIIAFHAVLPDSTTGSPWFYATESAFTRFCDYLERQELPVMSVQKAMRALSGE